MGIFMGNSMVLPLLWDFLGAFMELPGEFHGSAVLS